MRDLGEAGRGRETCMYTPFCGDMISGELMTGSFFFKFSASMLRLHNSSKATS